MMITRNQTKIKTVLTLAVVAMALFALTAVASANVGVLFADTFDRPDSTDLNASTAGKSGTLGSLNYGVEVHGDCSASIDNNMLKLRENGNGGGGAIIAYLDHNFVDASIASGGGFSVSIDLIDYASAGSGRWKAIVVGQSLAEVNGFSSNLPSASQDLFVGYRWTQTQLEVYKSGGYPTPASETDVSSYPLPQTMKIDYSFSDFNAGSTVGYDVYLGTDLITSGTFTWSGTDENYISIFSNLASDLSHFDNLEITGPSGGATDPSPADGTTVPVGTVDLSWTNADPNSPGDSVYVDVWFGTEPNETHPGYDMTKQVTDPVSGENVTSVTVSAPTEGTYYWRVNSYINGVINEPNMLEGSLWSFYAVDDAPPSVVIDTPDMITWSGQAIQLDATVTDDDESDLTIAWTADPADGITVEFSDPSIEDPTVTINKVPYSEALILNAGFEDPAAGDADYEWGATGWSITGDAGTWNPGPDYNTSGHGFGGIAPEGENVGWVWSTDSDTGFSQALAETLAVDTTYTLTVQVGQNSYYAISYGWGLWPGYKVQLLAGETVLDEDDNSLTPVPDTFETSTVTFDSTGVNPDWVGEPLEIRLLNKNAMETEIHFDDVKLVADPPFPARTGVETVTLTVAVSDAANPTPVGDMVDTMEIDVYDNACQMARIGLGLSNITDFDNNCITDLRDYAVLAAKWLVDYALTAPVAK